MQIIIHAIYWIMIYIDKANESNNNYEYQFFSHSKYQFSQYISSDIVLLNIRLNWLTQVIPDQF